MSSWILSFKGPRLINRLFPCVRRISQDLAKDLAILAREIHDVAGEIDSVSSSGTAPSTTVSTAATTPGSAIDTREEVGPARPTQPEIQESMKKVPDFLLLLWSYCLCFHFQLCFFDKTLLHHSFICFLLFNLISNIFNTYFNTRQVHILQILKLLLDFLNKFI